MSMSDRDAPPICDEDSETALDDFVRAFEEAHQGPGDVDLSSYLPPPGHPLSALVLRELVRIDLEFGWERGSPKRLADYLRAFPELAADADGLREVAYEEYRLRRRAGEEPSPDEYRGRYGLAIDPRSRRPLPAPAPGGGPPSGLAASALTREADSSKGWRLPDDVADLPEAGDEFLDFRLIRELGRGAFGRVYLARQGELADRPVVLKVTADRRNEARTLARFQHDHIVPVYSQHRDGPLRAVCMPYLGSVTLRDVLDDLKTQGRLPGSGRGLLSSLSKSSVRKGPGASAGAPTEGPEAGRPAAPDAPPTDRPRGPAAGPARGADAVKTDVLAKLGGLTYSGAVVWLGARLADGLAHAHDRGVLHRDMKPANVLLTDDGRPMLLDFNLAEDVGRNADDAGAGVGGTLPYMAPEHLEAYLGLRREVDARSDVYALGVILFELLTGRPPFPHRDGSRAETVRAMAADRLGPPPLLRPINPAVSPAVESIVRHCLEPDPPARYGSARELAEDLDRQLANRPLRHAPDPSRRERAVKWARRNRWLLIGIAALGFAGSAAAAVGSRQERLLGLEALEDLGRFRANAFDAEFLLRSRVHEPENRAKGLALAASALKPLGALDDPRWQDHAPASRLPVESRRALAGEAGGLLALTARAEARRADAMPKSDPAGRLRAWGEAARTAERAEACYPPARAPQGLLTLRAGLAERLGDPAAAAAFARRASASGWRDSGDAVLVANLQIDAHRYDLALETLERADPADLWAWEAKGCCYTRMGRDAEAEGCYNVCISIRDRHAASWFNRGASRYAQKKMAEAAADFDRAVELSPDEPEAYLNRALCRFALGRSSEAAADLSMAIAKGGVGNRYFFARAQARDKAGDPAGAARDRAEGLRREPTEEIDLVTRGIALARAGRDADALADFDRALDLNPWSDRALNNIAWVRSENLGDDLGGIDALDRVLTFRTGDLKARASRAVLLARRRLRASALADAEAVLAAVPCPPELVYQVAGAYALTSRDVPSDRDEAFRLLRAALDRGVDRRLLAIDPDLDPLRNHPAFRALAAAK